MYFWSMPYFLPSLPFTVQSPFARGIPIALSESSTCRTFAAIALSRRSVGVLGLTGA
jgi:hypothetical protein